MARMAVFGSREDTRALMYQTTEVEVYFKTGSLTIFTLSGYWLIGTIRNLQQLQQLIAIQR